MSESSGLNRGALFDFYRGMYLEMRKVDSVRHDQVEWKWLEEIKSISSEIAESLTIIRERVAAVGGEEQLMITELAGLDAHSSKLLSDQSALEKQVNELECKMGAIRAIREIGEIISNRNILVSDFPFFERAVVGLVDSMKYIASSSEPVMSVSKQLEHLRSRVCSVSVGVVSSAIELYLKRMEQYLSSQSTITVTPLFTKHSEVLRVVANISGLFRCLEGGDDFDSAVIEIEKIFCEARMKLVIPILNAYTRNAMVSMDLCTLLRKSVDFVHGLVLQEQSFFATYTGVNRNSGEAKSDTVNSDSLHQFLRAIGKEGLYSPLRTAVIAATDPVLLRESAEIIRLEILNGNHAVSSPFILSVVHKLHRDIQERLIYRIESYIRDVIGGDVGEPSKEETVSHQNVVQKTVHCLSLIAGVVDGQTFHEIAQEALNACVDRLVRSNAKNFNSKSNDTARLILLMAQLLELRERVTELDWDAGSVESSAKSFDPSAETSNGIAGAFRKLVTRRSPLVSSVTGGTHSIRSRIEGHLKSVCDEFNAVVIANIMARDVTSLPAYFGQIKEEIRKNFPDSYLTIKDVLFKPVVEELRSGIVGEVPVEQILLLLGTE